MPEDDMMLLTVVSLDRAIAVANILEESNRPSDLLVAYESDALRASFGIIVRAANLDLALLHSATVDVQHLKAETYARIELSVDQANGLIFQGEAKDASATVVEASKRAIQFLLSDLARSPFAALFAMPTNNLYNVYQGEHVLSLDKIRSDFLTIQAETQRLKSDQ